MSRSELLSLCKVGNQKAMENLYSMFSKRMMSIIRKYISDPDAAQDILHDGFIVIFTHISEVKDPNKLEYWMGTIMRNLSLQHLEQLDVFSTLDDDLDIEDVPELTEILTREELESLIDKLPVGYRTIFRLSVLENKSHKEIGKLLGIAPNSSSSQLFHAKNMLRRLITEYRIEMGLTILAGAIVTPLILLLNNTSKEIQIVKNQECAQKYKAQPNKEEPAQTFEPRNVTRNVISNTAIRTEQSYTLNISEIKKDEVFNADTISAIVSDTCLLDSVDTVKQSIYFIDKANRYQNYAHQMMSNKDSGSEWSFSIECSGHNNVERRENFLIPNPDITSSVPEIEEKKNIKHHVPFIIGVSLGKSINSRWSIESGLRYRLLNTDITVENKYNQSEENQQIHYIGIPIKVKYRIFGNERISIYGAGGLSIDIPIKGESMISNQSSITNESTYDKVKIKPSLQWSIETGVGIQYNINSTVSIFAEPSVNYYINPGTKVNTIYTDSPFEFSVPVGVRFTW